MRSGFACVFCDEWDGHAEDCNRNTAQLPSVRTRKTGKSSGSEGQARLDLQSRDNQQASGQSTDFYARQPGYGSACPTAPPNIPDNSQGRAPQGYSAPLPPQGHGALPHPHGHRTLPPLQGYGVSQPQNFYGFGQTPNRDTAAQASGGFGAHQAPISYGSTQGSGSVGTMQRLSGYGDVSGRGPPQTQDQAQDYGNQRPIPAHPQAPYPGYGSQAPVRPVPQNRSSLEGPGIPWWLARRPGYYDLPVFVREYVLETVPFFITFEPPHRDNGYTEDQWELYQSWRQSALSNLRWTTAGIPNGAIYFTFFKDNVPSRRALTGHRKKKSMDDFSIAKRRREGPSGGAPSGAA